VPAQPVKRHDGRKQRGIKKRGESGKKLVPHQKTYPAVSRTSGEQGKKGCRHLTLGEKGNQSKENRENKRKGDKKEILKGWRI